ncbi:hypothetical protein PACTADRAFT_31181 [Pachysolen tannophilus NRRL Y-2460]|uniref:VanZ-like domain-containing protein n=1 Tax=Pachysolen tannophilus NRRL Y-2460 TaxID=669874 RepID=A0A1E4U1G6_PACTA|nr:hypothetical protein PACTADRAFT_31181 [Pachysolen tannophilus NRRL Y-2460]
MRIRKPVLGSFSNIELSSYDKALHFVVFMVLTALFYFLVDVRDLKKLKILTFVICTVIASTTSEFLQDFLTGSRRKFDPMDILANMIGSAVGLIVADLYNKKLIRSRKLSRRARRRNNNNGATDDYDIEAQPAERDYDEDGDEEMLIQEQLSAQVTNHSNDSNDSKKQENPKSKSDLIILKNLPPEPIKD